jgi:hypothetical protein
MPNYFIGGVVHTDSNADNVTIYSDGNSNSKLTLTDFGGMEINILAKDSTNWLIWGFSEGADAPALQININKLGVECNDSTLEKEDKNGGMQFQRHTT